MTRSAIRENTGWNAPVLNPGDLGRLSVIFPLSSMLPGCNPPELLLTFPILYGRFDGILGEH